MSPGIRCFWDPSVREAAGPARRPAVSPVSLTADRPFFQNFLRKAATFRPRRLYIRQDGRNAGQNIHRKWKDG